MSLAQDLLGRQVAAGSQFGVGAREQRTQHFGDLVGDARFFANGSSQNDGFLLRRVEPTIEGSWGIASFRITPQLAGDSATINDAYIDLKFDPRASVRIGKAKAPFGLERLQSSASTAQVELGLPSELAPGRDIGVQLSGDVAGGALNYGIGVYNGAVDGRDGLTANPDGEFEYVGRLFWEPFKNSASNAGTLGIGVAASVGDTVGSGNNFLPRYRTPGQEQFFGYGSNIAADGERLRKTVQCYYYRGTFGVLGEWIESSQDVRVASGTGAGTRATLRNDAWQISGGWVLTGEDAGYRGVVKPSSPFAIGGDGWGALELAARYGRLEIDEGAFPLFANAASSAQAIRSWGLGLNWYLTQNFKLVTNYTQASFDGGAAAGADRADEKALFTRAQLSF
ncbi:MAG TPA: porin [Thermomonas sp.]|nr:porin [Thermomonas sp.]